MLSKKDQMPNCTALNENGESVSLHDYLGQKLVIFFYPKDNTPGCTIESCGFRDAYLDFKAAGAEVIGISRDSVKKHQNFITKYDLPFSLIADTESVVCDAFGVIKEKSMFGKKYMGIERSTFLMDEKGVIQHTWPKVKISGHVDEVLAAARAL